MLVAVIASLVLAQASSAPMCGDDVACWRRRVLDLSTRLEAAPLLERRAELAEQEALLCHAREAEAWRMVERIKPMALAERPWWDSPIFGGVLGVALGVGAAVGVAYAVKPAVR